MKTTSDEHKLKLDLEVLLPQVADERDQCILKLEEQLRTTRGITQAHIEKEDEHHTLCLHYDPSVLHLANLKRLTQRAGAKISNRYQHELLPIVGMDCSDCTLVIEHGIKRIDGILDASVSYVSGTLKVEYDTEKTNMDCLLRHRLASPLLDSCFFVLAVSTRSLWTLAWTMVRQKTCFSALLFLVRCHSRLRRWPLQFQNPPHGVLVLLSRVAC